MKGPPPFLKKNPAGPGLKPKGAPPMKNPLKRAPTQAAAKAGAPPMGGGEKPAPAGKPMKICPECQHRGTETFCPECGTRMEEMNKPEPAEPDADDVGDHEYR